MTKFFIEIDASIVDTVNCINIISILLVTTASLFSMYVFSTFYCWKMAKRKAFFSATMGGLRAAKLLFSDFLIIMSILKLRSLERDTEIKCIS